MAYRTPGVYIEEIPKLPSSVAQVETAIPAFIGYTEKAKIKEDGDLNLVPTRITSMLEYETYFGVGADEQFFSVDIDGTNIVVTGPDKKANRSPFVMYYSMQMYFANGGGPCYITSVGQFKYPKPTPPSEPVVPLPIVISVADLKKGLLEIEKEDEPTLLVFPEATFLSSVDDFYGLYNLALAQCTKLQDRFTIIDTFDDSSTGIKDLRDKIINDPLQLKYGGAYYPFLQTSLGYQYAAADVDVTNNNVRNYEGEVNDISAAIVTTELASLIDDVDDIVAPTDPGDLQDYKDAVDAAVTDAVDEIKNLEDQFDNAITVGNAAVVESDHSAPTYEDMVDANDALIAWVGSSLEQARINLKSALLAVQGAGDIATVTAQWTIIKGILTPGPTTTTIATKINTAKSSGVLFALAGELHPFSSPPITSPLSSYELNNNVLYNQIKAEIAKKYVELAPSATVAGIYARVDANRGVWKSPANESLNYVIKPTVLVTDEAQGDMNVTPTGKSVNAIRSFTGKGTLIWGARTLTGNSNEWRYISVRRFFNMVEESVKKASEPFVFESNDANTWVKVRSMIENFLTSQWKAGALAGAKTEQAFYVSIGLGETMTSLDVLEGRMIVEIGMAVVRPAEFIILRFSHKMQEA